MRHPFVLALAALCSACATSAKDAQPLDWPKTSGVTCSDIVGTYIDPDTVRGKTVTYYSNGYSESGGTLDSAWLLFGFYKVARHADPSVSFRKFSLAFDPQKTFVITYIINGAEVARKEISPSEYKCEHGLLKFVAWSRTGDQVFDMLPNHGTITHFAELLRSGNTLYVKFTDKTSAIFYGVFPSSHINVRWQRFPAQ